jgi:uroporphyrin-III C-methyltransferase/precorrin-2 dehydrogenase/sirohydrochlorin ferrochelatase
MDYLPTFLKLTGRPVLVVGGGEAAARKVELLHKTDAAIHVVAPRLNHALAHLAETGAIAWSARPFRPSDLDGMAVVISATTDDTADRGVAAAAQTAGIPVNVVDRPDLSTFIVPAIIDRDPIIIGISSGGAAPVLARRLRADIEHRLPARLGRLARFAGSFRSAVMAKVSDAGARRRLWETVFDGPIADRVLAGEESSAREAMLHLINRRNADAPHQGKVAIVGAGPGDPDLLTFKALRAMQAADIVVYDRLIGDDILDYVRRDAERVFVGKAKGCHALPQDRINQLLIDRARAGQMVVRLKGGDPFVFGRGGEEIEALRAADIAVEIVPGITAATGCAAAAGLPLTHRDHASAVTFVTGHGSEGEPDLDWPALAALDHTLVVYMGLSTAGVIAARLIDHGKQPDTPAAIVENGTRPNQRVVTGTLAQLETLVAQHAINGPALIVIGDVAALALTSAAEFGTSPLRALAG